MSEDTAPPGSPPAPGIHPADRRSPRRRERPLSSREAVSRTGSRRHLQPEGLPRRPDPVSPNLVRRLTRDSPGDLEEVGVVEAPAGDDGFRRRPAHRRRVVQRDVRSPLPTVPAPGRTAGAVPPVPPRPALRRYAAGGTLAVQGETLKRAYANQRAWENFTPMPRAGCTPGWPSKDSRRSTTGRPRSCWSRKVGLLVDGRHGCHGSVEVLAGLGAGEGGDPKSKTPPSAATGR